MCRLAWIEYASLWRQSTDDLVRGLKLNKLFNVNDVSVERNSSVSHDFLDRKIQNANYC